jgi:TRAP-type mannitol/chloroaromatic compound transport system permease large subunit
MLISQVVFIFFLAYSVAYFEIMLLFVLENVFVPVDARCACR